MSHPLEKLKRDFSSVRLSTDEKTQLHEDMRAFLSSHPYPASYKSFWYSYRIPAFASLATIILLCSAVTVRANTAIPGDFLYPVKLNVNEPVEGLLAFSDEDKARVKIEFTKRRLEETVHLIAEGRIEQEHIDQIKDKIGDYSDDVQEYIDKNKEEGNIAQALETSSEMSTVFSANQKVLETAAEQIQEFKPEINSLNDQLNSYQDIYQDQAVTLQTANEFATSDTYQDQVGENLTEAQEALNQALEVVDDSLATSTASTVQEIIDEGKKKAESGDSKSAFILFEKAEQTADEITIISESQDILEESAE